MKKLLSTVLLSYLGSTVAYANDVMLINNTSSVATALYKSFDGDFCSSILGKAQGILAANGGKLPVTDQVIYNNCSLDDCIADVYLSNNCKGNKVATITMSYKSGGIKNVINLKPDQYTIQWTHIEASISERVA